MTKKRTAVVLLSMIMLLSLLLAACGGGGGGGGGDALKGTWEGLRDSTGITFKFDGKGGCDTEDEYGIKDTGTYTIVDDSTVKIKMSYWDNEMLTIILFPETSWLWIRMNPPSCLRPTKQNSSKSGRWRKLFPLKFVQIYSCTKAAYKCELHIIRKAVHHGQEKGFIDYEPGDSLGFNNRPVKSQ